MNVVDANETDIREEIVAPLLEALGYKRGTENDIAREMPLSYQREFLGRKKKTDPPLRGRADYMLSVTGAGRWILEVKAPHQPIDVDAIDQAISYARHSEVCACYSVILNGLRLTVHHASQRSTDPPLVDLEITTHHELVQKIGGLLSPAAIRRDCSPPAVDLSLPLADGLRSHARIRGGQIRHRLFQWSTNFPLPPQQHAQIEEMGRRLTSLVIPVTGGEVRRDENSRIRGRLVVAFPNDELLQFALNKKLMDVEYVALATQISADAENPTVFDLVGDVKVSEGEALFDIIRWETETAGIAMHMSYQAQATGSIENNLFKGLYEARYDSSFPTLRGVHMMITVKGDFSVAIDPR